MKQITLGNNLKKLSKVLTLKKIKCTNFASSFKYNLIAILFALPMFLQAQTSTIPTNLDFTVGEYTLGGQTQSYQINAKRSISKIEDKFYLNLGKGEIYLLTPKVNTYSFVIADGYLAGQKLELLYNEKGTIYLGFKHYNHYFFLNKTVVGNTAPKVKDRFKNIIFGYSKQIQKFNLKDLFLDDDNDVLTYYIESESTQYLTAKISADDRSVADIKTIENVSSIDNFSYSSLFTIIAVDNKGGIVSHNFRAFVASEDFPGVIIENNKPFKIFPNPAKDYFTISDKNIYSYSIKINSLSTGKQVKNLFYVSSPDGVQIFCDDWIPDTYVITLVSNITGTIKTQKLIKK